MKLIHEGKSVLFLLLFFVLIFFLKPKDCVLLICPGLERGLKLIIFGFVILCVSLYFVKKGTTYFGNAVMLK